MKYAIVVEKGETSYGAYVPDLPGCAAAAETREEAVKLIKEAIEFHLDGLRSDGEQIPESHSEMEYVEVAEVGILTVGILCGGFGTRMGEMGKSIPKALFEVCGKPILGHIIQGLEAIPGPVQIRVVSNTVFTPKLQSWSQSQPPRGHPVTVLNNGVASVEQRLGSIGDMQYIVEHGGGDAPAASDLLIIGSDNLYKFSLNSFLEFARPRGAAVAVCDIGDLSEARRFGVVTMDTSGKLLTFEEKPENPRSTMIATCIYYLPARDVPRIKAYLDSGRNPDKAGSLIAWLLEQTAVYGWRGDGAWFDIGSPEALLEAQKAFA